MIQAMKVFGTKWNKIQAAYFSHRSPMTVTAKGGSLACSAKKLQVKLEASHQAGRGGAGSGAVSMGMGGGGYSGMGGNDGGVGALSALEDAEVTLGGAERLVL